MVNHMYLKLFIILTTVCISVKFFGRTDQHRQSQRVYPIDFARHGN